MPMTAALVPAAELERRLHQQDFVVQFGAFALACRDEPVLLHEAARVVAEGTAGTLGKVLRYRAEQRDMLVIAGVGWDDGVIGSAALSVDEGSPAGFAFLRDEPVLTNDLDGETRFRTPDLLRDHGVRAAINVPILCHGARFGVLEVDSRAAHCFTVADRSFLLAVANVLGLAMERHRAQIKLDRVNQMRTTQAEELRHRIKNMFAVVHSLVGLSEREARKIGNPEAAFLVLRDRIEALARASNIGSGTLDMAANTVDVVELTGAVLQAYEGKVQVTGERVLVPSLWSTPLGMLLYELVTNAVKYGALSRDEGRIAVHWSIESGDLMCRWAETGGGPPPTPTPARKADGFGTRMIDAVASQIGGTLTREWAAEGLIVYLRVARPDEGNGMSGA